jgi:hypothetical protein
VTRGNVRPGSWRIISSTGSEREACHQRGHGNQTERRVSTKQGTEFVARRRAAHARHDRRANSP